jgi:hypothetical protein
VEVFIAHGCGVGREVDRVLADTTDGFIAAL